MRINISQVITFDACILVINGFNMGIIIFSLRASLVTKWLVIALLLISSAFLIWAIMRTMDSLVEGCLRVFHRQANSALEKIGHKIDFEGGEIVVKKIAGRKKGA